MKRIMGLLVVVALIVLCVGVVRAEDEFTVEFNIKDGNLNAAIVNWQPTGMKVSEAAVKYPEAVRDAYITGSTIAVRTEEAPVIVDWLHVRRDTVRTLGVKCYPGNIIDVCYDRKVIPGGVGKLEFFWFPVFWLVLLGALGIFVVMLGKIEPNSVVSDRYGLLLTSSAVIALGIFFFLAGTVVWIDSVLVWGALFFSVIIFITRSCKLHDKGETATLSGITVLVLMMAVAVCEYHPLLLSLF